MSSESECVLEGRVPNDISAIVSDIDGTLAHYAKTMVIQGYVESSEAEYHLYKANRDATAARTDMEPLLQACFPQTDRDVRFSGVPCKYWQHGTSGKVLKLYELYNLSLSGGLISEDTILLMELLQCPEKLYSGLLHGVGTSDILHYGVLCTLITGARTSTFRFRRESAALPQTCFDSCEGGGKIWCRLRDTASWTPLADPQGACARQILERRFVPFPEHGEFDQPWLDTFYPVTGYRGTVEDEKPDRTFPLWELEDVLNAEGFRTDHREYFTSFQIYIKESPCVGICNATDEERAAFPRTFETPAEAEAYLKRVFEKEYHEKYGVTLHINLGRGQVNASGCGKKEAMLHILEKCERTMKPKGCQQAFFCPENTVALFDDANDLPFAEQCGIGFLPSVAHTEVLNHPTWQHEKGIRWFRPPVDGPLGSEWALWQIALYKRGRLLSLPVS